MDPQACLEEALDLAAAVIKGIDELPTGEYEGNGYIVQSLIDNGSELAEHVKGLTEWLAKGGFAPDWEKALNR